MMSPQSSAVHKSPFADSGIDFAHQPSADWPPSTLSQPRLVLVHDARPTDVTAIVEQELRQFAEYLASTFSHDIHRAQAHPPTWYREQLGADECSYDDATFLRLLTMIACREHRALVITQPPADGRLQPLPHLDDVSLWEFWTGMAVVCALMAAFVLYWWVSPTDLELREMQFGPHAIAQTEVQR